MSEVESTLPLERAVIAAIILDARVIPMAVDAVHGDDFSDARLGRIFEGMVLMAARREPVDVLTVSDKLTEWGVRGVEPAQLHEWVSEVPTAQNVGWYAERVRSAAVMRVLRAEAVRLAQAADGSTPAGEVLARSIERLKDVQASRAKADGITSRKLGDVLVGDDDYDWVIPDLFERGDRLLLTGQEGGGKTTLMRQIAVMAASGIHPFRFGPIDPVRVLVVDAENGEKQWRREVRPMVDRAGVHGRRNPADAMELACVRRLDLSRDQDLGMLHKLVDDVAPDLMVIGPLYRLIPRAINSDDDAAPLLAALDTLRDRGISLLIEAHAGHAVGAGGQRDMRPRGSAALLGWPEFGLGLRRDSSDKGLSHLVRWRGDRDAKREMPKRLRRGQLWPWEPTA